MRRAILVSILALVQISIFTGIASAGEPDFRDDFDSFDTARWSKQEHTLGRSYLDPSNVFVHNGNLEMRLPSGTLEGAEIASVGLYQQGVYVTRMRLPYAPSSITAFFLYKSPDYEHEIDIELYNDSSRRIMFTTYSGGSMTNHETIKLPFDPTRGFHNYRFDYGTGYVKFLRRR